MRHSHSSRLGLRRQKLAELRHQLRYAVPADQPQLKNLVDYWQRHPDV